MHLLRQIVEAFPPGVSAAFAYGSGAIRQGGANSEPSSKMLDFVFVVDEPRVWHAANIARHPSHYSFLRALGSGCVTSLQQRSAGVYYNTLVPFHVPERGDSLIKYGVIAAADFEADLLNWTSLYVSGRLQKPVAWVLEPRAPEYAVAIATNLRSALCCALLQLPERFSSLELFTAIAGLSYTGDFRMWVGEDKGKVGKIVAPQLTRFQELYEAPLADCGWAVAPLREGLFERGLEPEVQRRLLGGLAPRLRQNLVVTSQSAAANEEAVLEALSCADWRSSADGCRAALSRLVFWPSLSQAAKGLLTAGVTKSLRYSGAKLGKMLRSLRV